MELEEILQLPAFNLPAVNNTGEPFITYAENTLTAYVNNIKSSPDLFNSSPAKFEPYDKFCKTIEGFSNDLVQVIRTSKVSRSEAYVSFQNVMTRASNFIFGLYDLRFEINKHQVLFRCNQGDKILGQDRFFHAAFDVDERIPGTRFSASGSPALYLTNGLVVGFREINLTEPEALKLQAVKFATQSKLYFLDMDHNPPHRDLKATNKDQYDARLQVKALLFPLLFLCNCAKLHPDVPAPQEYIIPQFLGQWIRDTKKFDGIKYASTKINPVTNSKDFYNLFLPPRVYADKGHCTELKKLFHLSNVCHLRTHEKEIVDYFNANFPVGGLISTDILRVDWDGAIAAYETIIVGQMEFFLNETMLPAPVLF